MDRAVGGARVVGECAGEGGFNGFRPGFSGRAQELKRSGAGRECGFPYYELVEAWNDIHGGMER